MARGQPVVETAAGARQAIGACGRRKARLRELGAGRGRKRVAARGVGV
ncbi:MAG: hypothetical protein ACXWQR_18390 [Ktedonobacterales bacterium]